jgi:nucleoside-diphosphate-sugar epimerase
VDENMTIERTAFVTGGTGFVGSRLIMELVRNGWKVNALARSSAACKALQLMGATPVKGELNTLNALEQGMKGSEIVFHIAAHFKLWGRREEFERINIGGTQAVVDAATMTPSVKKIVYVSAAAVILGDPQPMLDVDENQPKQSRSFAPYSSSKAKAEQLLLAANNKRPEFETIAIRPPLIWGAGMPMLKQMAATVKAGQWQWIDGGNQSMSTCHVDNLVSALLLTADKGTGGEAYFITDEKTGTLKVIISELLNTCGITVKDKSVSFRAAWLLAGLMGMTWRILRLKGEPPLTRQMLQLIGKTLTLNTAKARRELGYAPVKSWAEGIREMK